MSKLIFYTDGAFSSARNQGGIGLVCLKDGVEILRYSKMYKNTTNNRMEMRAVIAALLSVRKEVESITIVSDSQYVIGCASKGWQRKKNADLWKAYDKAYEKASVLCKDIHFEWVHGHDGDKYNEICDKLAVKASQQL